MVYLYKINFSYILKEGILKCNNCYNTKEEIKSKNYDKIDISVVDSNIMLSFFTNKEIQTDIISKLNKLVENIKNINDLNEIKPSIISLIKEIQ